MYLTSDGYFHLDSVSRMWKSSVMPLKTLGSSLYELIIKVNHLKDYVNLMPKYLALVT
jgi:hypothetical protein